MKKIIVITLGLIFCFLHANDQLFIDGTLPNELAEFVYNEDNYRAGYDEGTNIEENLNFVAISLGCRCSAANFLRDYKIRPFAFPFDWCVTPYKALYYFIKNDFNGFFKKDNLVHGSNPSLSDEKKSDVIHYLGLVNNYFSNPNVLIDKDSGIVFSHDFPNIEAVNKNYETQHAKYLRRIKRFYEHIDSGKHVYFIRFHWITKQDALDLYTLLKEKFPKISFTLIVIGQDKNEFSIDWKHPHIKNYFSSGTKGFWDTLYDDIITGTLAPYLSKVTLVN